MISQVKIIFFGLLFLVVFTNIASKNRSKFNEIEHKISIKHPGEKDIINTYLIEVRDENGLAIEYYMDVESVICLAEVCKVIPVTLYWNNIGEYQRYKLQEGTTLEKYESDLFESNDYKKLHRILKDKYSPFSDVFIEDIWNIPTTIKKEDIDAISGATILALDDEDTVPGAALTCYTLWHWANGNVISIIRKKTGESASEDQLKTFISDKSKAYFNIALDALNTQNVYSKAMINLIIERVKKDNALLKNTFSYLENTPSELYKKAISNLFFNGGKFQKLAVIRSLKMENTKVSSEFLDTLSSEFKDLKSFQEVSALIDLMESKNHTSLIVNKNVFLLLESEFLVARRAYWFLSNQNLNLIEQKKLKTFHKKYKEKL